MADKGVGHDGPKATGDHVRHFGAEEIVVEKGGFVATAGNAGVAKGEGPRGGVHVHGCAAVAQVLEKRGGWVGSGCGRNVARLRRPRWAVTKAFRLIGCEALGGKYDGLTKFVIEGRGGQDG